MSGLSILYNPFSHTKPQSGCRSEANHSLLWGVAVKAAIVSSCALSTFVGWSRVVPDFFSGYAFTLFANTLVSKLAEKLDDINRARALANFCKRLQINLSKSDQLLLENWILKYCQVLSSVASKEEGLLEELNSPALHKIKEQIIQFLQKIDLELPVVQGAKRIAILYTGLGGGGHKTPAFAIKEKLIAEAFRVEMIDTDEIEREFEPKIFGRGHEDIWTEFYQRKGQPVLAEYLWKLHHMLYRPECRKTTEVVFNKLVSFNPGCIITVADHKPQFASLAYRLNRNMIFVHTDNKFTRKKLGEIAEIQTRFRKALVSFTKPTTAEPLNYENTLPKIAGIRNQLVELQIPVRRGFRSLASEEQKEIKREMGFDPSVKICLIMMGNNGIESEVWSILNRIHDERFETQERVHLIFVCGRNQELVAALHAYPKTFDGTAITMEVKGFLESPQMVKVAQAADVWITKMGGSTSSEALAMRKKVLSVSIPSHRWEDRNALANHACGLSDPLSRTEKILPQIIRAYNKPAPSCYIPNWEEQLMLILSGAFKYD